MKERFLDQIKRGQIMVIGGVGGGTLGLNTNCLM